MAGQKTAAIVALIQKQADGIAFVETHLVADAVFQNLKPLRRSFAKDQLRRGFGRGGAADLARKNFVIRAARRKIFGEPRQFFALLCAQRRFGLREQKIAELFHKPARPAVARAVNQAKGVCRFRLDDGSAQSEARFDIKIRPAQKISPARSWPDA